MKTKISTFLLAAVLLGSTALFSSCGKEEEPGTGGGGSTPKANSLTATIGTKILDPVAAPTVVYEAGTGNLNITVNDKDQVTTLAIYFNVNQGNSLTFGSTAFGNVQTSATSEGLYTADGGTITLTTNDKANRIAEGTFSFSAKNLQQANVDVSNGKFYVKY
ncbi:MAG: hypothetical protein LPK49_08935 [Bacteroidota bacterium]|nr:hypothetical protein [Bacteroidota bacterium]MDX5431154.1 hypothetical protein [Bacteroidota bacterium]